MLSPTTKLLPSCVTASPGHVSSQVLQRIHISGSMRCCLINSWVGAFMSFNPVQSRRFDLDVFEIAGLVVDAHLRRRDPVRELARFADRLHQRGDEVAVVDRGQIVALYLRPFGGADDNALGRRLYD